MILLVLLLAAALLGCGPPPTPSGESAPGKTSRPAGAPPPAGAPLLAGRAARVGEEPVPLVEIAENHSDAFVRWVLHGVRNRILVHVDGHIDLDWLPPETIESIRAATDEPSLRTLEAHPYDLSARANTGFGIWNFIYPAARTERVREEVWVVPDGALADQAAFDRLRSGLAETLSGVSLDEYRGLRFSGGAVSGSLAGVPVMIVERNGLPRFPEPVLLDIDLDYFTTDSPVDQRVMLAPRLSTDALIESLADRGVTTDLATVSYSTVAGYLPYEDRHLGDEISLALRDPQRFRSPAMRRRRQDRMKALAALASGRPAEALRALLALSRQNPKDSPVYVALADAHRRLGQIREAKACESRARSIDPSAARLDLYRGDVERLGGRNEEALALFRKYVAEHPEDDAAPYASRRVAFCLFDLHRVTEAAAAYRQLLALRPDHADSHFNLAEALAASGDFRAAASEQQQACRLRPFDPYYSWRLGTYFLRAKEPASAEPHLRRAVEGRPASAWSHYNLAICLASQGRFSEALPHAETAAELDPASTGFPVLAEKLREMSLQRSAR